MTLRLACIISLNLHDVFCSRIDIICCVQMRTLQGYLNLNNIVKQHKIQIQFCILNLMTFANCISDKIFFILIILVITLVRHIEFILETLKLVIISTVITKIYHNMKI